MSKIERQMAIPTKIKTMTIPPIPQESHEVFLERFVSAGSSGPVSPYRDVDSSSISDMLAGNGGTSNLPKVHDRPFSIEIGDAVIIQSGSKPHSKSSIGQSRDVKTVETVIAQIEEEEDEPEEPESSIYKSMNQVDNLFNKYRRVLNAKSRALGGTRLYEEKEDLPVSEPEPEPEVIKEASQDLSKQESVDDERSVSSDHQVRDVEEDNGSPSRVSSTDTKDIERTKSANSIKSDGAKPEIDPQAPSKCDFILIPNFRCAVIQSR
jgi:hypothetical protein